MYNIIECALEANFNCSIVGFCCCYMYVCVCVRVEIIRKCTAYALKYAFGSLARRSICVFFFLLLTINYIHKPKE